MMLLKFLVKIGVSAKNALKRYFFQNFGAIGAEIFEVCPPWGRLPYLSDMKPKVKGWAPFPARKRNLIPHFGC